MEAKQRMRKIHLDKEDYDKFKKIADETGRTVDALVIEGLESIVQKSKSQVET
jgi:hypothetical protein